MLYSRKPCRPTTWHEVLKIRSSSFTSPSFSLSIILTIMTFVLSVSGCWFRSLHAFLRRCFMNSNLIFRIYVLWSLCGAVKKDFLNVLFIFFSTRKQSNALNTELLYVWSSFNTFFGLLLLLSSVWHDTAEEVLVRLTCVSLSCYSQLDTKDNTPWACHCLPASWALPYACSASRPPHSSLVSQPPRSRLLQHNILTLTEPSHSFEILLWINCLK